MRSLRYFIGKSPPVMQRRQAYSQTAPFLEPLTKPGLGLAARHLRAGRGERRRRCLSASLTTNDEGMRRNHRRPFGLPRRLGSLGRRTAVCSVPAPQRVLQGEKARLPGEKARLPGEKARLPSRLCRRALHPAIRRSQQAQIQVLLEALMQNSIV